MTRVRFIIDAEADPALVAEIENRFEVLIPALELDDLTTVVEGGSLSIEHIDFENLED